LQLAAGGWACDGRWQDSSELEWPTATGQPLGLSSFLLCHPERSEREAKRTAHGVEGPLIDCSTGTDDGHFHFRYIRRSGWPRKKTRARNQIVSA
jgi:hypothetical protein